MDIVLRKIFRVKNSSSNPLSVRNLCKAEIKLKIKPLDIIRVQHFIIPFERNMRKSEQEGVNCPIEYPKKKKKTNFRITLQTNFLPISSPRPETRRKITARRILKLPDWATKYPTKPSNYSNKTNFLVFRHLNLGTERHRSETVIHAKDVP